MATTERHKLPATILSRCQQFIFRTISPAEIQGHLRQIADREGVKIDDRALGYVVRASEGSMRDAQSLLDQIISFSGQEVVDEDVRDVLGFIPAEILDQTVDALASRDSKELLKNIGIVIDQGLNVQQYVREFIGRIRDLLVLKLGLEEKILGSAEEKRALEARAEAFSEQDLIRFFDMLLRLESDLRWTSQPRFQLEVGFIKLAKIGHVRDIEEVLREVKSGESQQAPPRPPQRAKPEPPPSPAPRQTVARDVTAVKHPVVAKEETPPPNPAGTSFSETFNHLVEEKSATTAVYLQKAERVERVGDVIKIVLTTPTQLSLLESKEHKAVLDAAASELIGKAVSVSLIIKGSQEKEGAAVENVKNEPLVKRFLEVFRGDLAQVKPAKGE